MEILEKHTRYGIGFIVVLLTGCSIGQMNLKVDPVLQSNAVVHEVHTPSAVAFKRNFTFGQYSARDAQAFIKSTTQSSSAETNWMDALLGKDAHKTATKTTTRTHAYQFDIGQNETWDARCNLGSQQIESESGRLKATAVLSYRYVCEYTHPEQESWFLTMEKGEGRGVVFRMSNQRMSISTEVTDGDILYKDGSRREPLSPFITGYTWVFDDKKVGAVSVFEWTRRVWLDKSNSEAMNDALAMASAGILMLYWKIGPSCCS